MSVTAKTLRAARLALGLGQDELAQLAGLNRRTVMRIENSKGPYINESFEALRKALETKGVVFVTVDGRQGFTFPQD